MGINDDDFHAHRFELGDQEVHVWTADLADAAAHESRWQPLLSAEERGRAARFRFDGDRRRFTAARGLLRMLLGAYLKAAPATLSFRYSEKGKPALDGPHSETGLAFNVSHSGAVALFGVTRGREIGVDVEQMSRESDLEAIARRFFSVHEQAQLAAVAPEQRREAFFRCWSRKEAYIKARGEGLSLPLSQFDVSIGLGDGNALLATRPDPEEAQRWFLRDVPVEAGYAAAVAAFGAPWHLTQLHVSTELVAE